MVDYRLEEFLKNYNHRSTGCYSRGSLNEDYIFISKMVKSTLVVLIKCMEASKQNSISIGDIQELLSNAKDTYNLELATKIQLG